MGVAALAKFWRKRIETFVGWRTALFARSTLSRRWLWAGLAWSLGLAAPADAALTEAPRLKAAYDLILAADFDGAETALGTRCAPAPREACQVLGVAAAWWRILHDPESRALDAAFVTRARAAIDAADAWTRREPERAEAWFYLAGSYAPLVQWRVMRNERLAAALDGKRIKDSLERALALDPTLADAHFGIGLYHYYAAVAPAAAKMLRFLLLLPGGDRATGLREMTDARERGALLRGEADYQLHWLYVWYENRPRDALRLLEGLSSQYPTNPLFVQRRAEVTSDYVHDHPASARLWEALLDAARRGAVRGAAVVEVRARLGIAAEFDAMFETDRAIDHLRAATRIESTAPHGGAARAYVQLGDAYNRLAKRADALAAYRAARFRVPADDASGLGARIRKGMQRQPEDGDRAYAFSLDGWRALQRGEATQGVALLAHASQLAPSDQVIRVRHAVALRANGDLVGAQRHLEDALRARVPIPDVIRATAFVEYASILESGGDRSRAMEYYTRAIDASGGEERAYERARLALARLQR